MYIMSSELNNHLTPNRLLEEAKVLNKKDYATVSQQAVIGNHKVNISLNFERNLTRVEANQAMQDNLGKVADIVNSCHLGESKSEPTILSVTLHPDSNIEGKMQGVVKESFISKEPPPLPPRPVLSATPTSLGTVGKMFTVTHKLKAADGSSIIAKEKVERADTVQTMISGLNAKIEALNDKLGVLKKQPPSDLNHGKIQLLEKEIEKNKKSLSIYSQHAQDQKATHGSSNMPRVAFRMLGRETAKNDMAPILTNLRMQTVENSDGKRVSAVTRSGAMTDFRNGEVSLQELKHLRDLENYSGLPPEKKQSLARFYCMEKGNEVAHAKTIALQIKAKALVGYGSEKLVINPLSNEQIAVLKKLESSRSIESQFEKLSESEKKLLSSIQIDDTKLNQVMSERSSFIKLLVLQDLQLHLKTNPASEGPILYGRTAVTDLNKVAVKEYGCVIHERTQGLDAKAVFDELRGAKVLFDCKPHQEAYIDDEGQIHMPLTCASAGVKSLELNPVFFNICVEGSKEHIFNVGMQKYINDEALANLEKYSGNTPEFTQLKQALTLLTANSKTDPNQVVLLTTQYFHKQGGYCGVNCFGGKDRTGYNLALVTHAKLAEMAGRAPDDPEMGKIGRKLLSTKGIAALVAKDNADHTTLKISRIDLSLYDLETRKGKMLRMAQGCDAAYLKIKSEVKKELGFSGLMESSTPGQLYRAKPSHHSIKSKIANSFNRSMSSIQLEIRDL